MNRDELERLRAELWRRPLRPEESARLRAWLQAHPEAREEWALEEALTRVLYELPDRELPAGFEARVRAAIEREIRRPAPVLPAGWDFWAAARAAWFRWAMVGATALLAGVVWWRAHVAFQPLSPEVVRVWNEWAAPPEVWADFEVVARLPAGPGPDTELLTLLQ